MTVRIRSNKLLLAGLFLLASTGCGHRQGTVPVAQAVKPIAVEPQMLVVAPRASQTFKSNPPAVQFDYPADWHPCKSATQTLILAGPAGASFCLDIPKLPWHIPGMIPIGLVASGYVDDLRKNLIHDAVVQEQTTFKACGTNARRITCVGHVNGKPSVDVAVIMIHNDQVFILSTDSDDANRAVARQMLDDAVASLKWAK
jgi:hypothetical protein